MYYSMYCSSIFIITTSNEETANRILQKGDIYSWASTKAQITACTVQLWSLIIKNMKRFRTFQKAYWLPFKSAQKAASYDIFLCYCNLVSVWKFLVLLRLHSAFEKSWNYLWSCHKQAVNFLLIYEANNQGNCKNFVSKPMSSVTVGGQNNFFRKVD